MPTYSSLTDPCLRRDNALAFLHAALPQHIGQASTKVQQPYVSSLCCAPACAPVDCVLHARSHHANTSVRGQAIWTKDYTELLALMDGDHTRAGFMASMPLSNPYVCAGAGHLGQGLHRSCSR